MQEIPEYILEKLDGQARWRVCIDGKHVGSIWLDLDDTEYLEAPSLHSVAEEKRYQEQGVERAVIKDTVKYAYCNLPYQAIYTRYETENQSLEALYKSLGFESDGKPYEDDEGVEWQNAKVLL